MSASSDEALLVCTASNWSGDPKRCRWCDETLEGRQQRWCSHECANQFGRNHWWTSASPAARKRDNHRCVRCGRGPLDTDAERVLGVQAHHKVPLQTLTISVWGWDRGRQCSVQETRKVRHSDGGCWHHLDGLETLCDDCHYEEHHPVSESPQIVLDV